MKKTKKNIRWKSVKTPYSPEFNNFTLVKVVGWNRPGFASWSFIELKWDLQFTDPAELEDLDKLIVTSWLAVPR